MTSQWRLRWAAVLATSLIGIVGEPLAGSLQHLPFQYGDVFWIVGLAVVPFLAVPTWRNTETPLLGWVQVAHPLFYSLGFYWQYPFDGQSWLWPLLVLLGNLSFVAYWWLNAIDDDGHLRNPLARVIIGLGTVVWTGIGLVILLCYVPDPPSAPQSAYAVFPGGPLYRSLFSDSPWSPGVVIYKALLISVAALTVWLAMHARPHEKRARWLIAAMAIVGAGWGSGLEDVGDSWLLGPNGVFATLVTFAEFVVIPYLVVVLTARGRQRASAERSPEHLDALAAQPFTYAAVGATATTPPPGYDAFTRSRVLNHQDFARAAEDLMTWQVQRRAGLTVTASSPVVATDTVVTMGLGVGPFALRIPCRVVYVVDEPDVKGFAYGTLPGHPESGEECFLVSRCSDGQVELTVSAFSRPAGRLARIGGPVSRRVQRAMTTRYLATLDS